ncbi:MAG TPA: hypothetical protein VGL62_07560 [Vicinamibacterales bacterium]
MQVIDVAAVAGVCHAAGEPALDETVEEFPHVLARLDAAERGVLAAQAEAGVERDGDDEARLTVGEAQRLGRGDALFECQRRQRSHLR